MSEPSAEFTHATLARIFIANPWCGYVGPAPAPVNLVSSSVIDNAVGFGTVVPVSFAIHW